MTSCLCILKDMNNSRRRYVVSLHFNSQSSFVRPLRRDDYYFLSRYSTILEANIDISHFYLFHELYKTVSVAVRYTMEQISIANIYCFIRKRRETLYFRRKSKYKWIVSWKCISIPSRVLNFLVVKRENILVKRNNERVDRIQRMKRRNEEIV